MGRNKVFVADQVIDLAVGHMRLVTHHHNGLQMRQLVDQGLDNGHQVHVDKQHSVFGVIENILQLLREQSGVDGVANAADARRGVIHLVVAPGIPGQRRYAVTRFYAPVQQGVGELAGALGRLFLGGSVNTAIFNLAADNFRVGVADYTKFQQTGNQ